MADLFERIHSQRGPIGEHADASHGYFTFPKLEGPIGSHMQFHGRDVLVWSVNNYLGLADLPEIRQIDAQASADYGMARPMGARIMTGESEEHEALENELSEFVSKPSTVLLNFGYQGMLSAIDALLTRHDVVIHDALCHACILDGVRLHLGKRLSFPHNDIGILERRLEHAAGVVERTGGGILVITEGVFGMAGSQGRLADIVALKERFEFRLFVDDAHGVGTLGATGAGTGEEQGVQDEVDLVFGTFAKSFASIGAFISGPRSVTDFLRYNMRSQVAAKSLPLPIVVGARKRLELIRSRPDLREQLWVVTRALQQGLRDAGFDIGPCQAPVTPVYLNGSIPEATYLVHDLRENYGVFCSVVVPPIVPPGTIILRLIPTALHTLEDVERTLKAFRAIRTKLTAGEYAADEIVPIP